MDDSAAPGDVGQDRLGQEEDGAGVDGEDGVVGLSCYVLDRQHFADAGVVDEDVDLRSGEGRQGLLDDDLGGLLILEVGLDGNSGGPELGDLRD